MATHSSTGAWNIPWTEKPGRLQPMGCKELGTTEQLRFHLGSSIHSAVKSLNNNFLKTLKKKSNGGLPWWTSG